jgi:GH15 family glucan-1,4-alpha-glucosidase
MSEGMPDHGLDLAVIGNCRTAALVDPTARLVWWCFPRFDADPVFSRLLAGDEEKGFSDVVLDGMTHHESDYERNTAIVSTVLSDGRGNAVRVTDFAPRFRQFGRMFRPPQLFRVIEPVAGLPRITIRVRPTHSYGKPAKRYSVGSNHIRYHHDDQAIMRVTTDAPLALIENETPFVLTRAVHMVFGSDEGFPGDLAATAHSFAEQTRHYWSDWVRRLYISYDWQEAIIRAAITLKLSNFEETGGIIAAHTTSIPEAPGSGRNWDYRFCWLRDAYFVVKALNRVGATQTMEDFIGFTLSLAANEGVLKPVYSVVPNLSLDEWIAENLPGYRGDGPVRIGNAAVEQVQHDTYGSIILAALPLFFDRRLPRPGGEKLFRLLETLGEKAAAVALQPDAGIWEYRGRQRVHTHSAAMCWAGINRLASIAERLGLNDRAAYWNSIADPIHQELMSKAWNPEREAFTAAFGSTDLDASVLLLPDLGVCDVDDPRFIKTVAAMERELLREKHVMRYAAEDDFGLPVTAFMICRFWLIDAWWAQGRREEARELFVDALAHRNRYGLLSEDVDPRTGALFGNFPQTYSMAGLILTGMKLSRNWEDRYWRS